MKRNTMRSLAMALALALAAGTTLADDWEEAQEAFAQYDDRRALEALRSGAQAGDARAQQAWGLALHHGERLFPGLLRADPQAARRWLTAAAAAAVSIAPQDVPAKKRTRLGLYLSAVQAAALKAAAPREVLLLDIRSRAEAAYVGMAEAADALVPYMEHDEFMSDWDDARATFKVSEMGGFAGDVARALAERGLGKEATIVLLCRSGDRSARAADLLAGLGYERVYSVLDGFEGDLSPEGRRDVNGWKNAGLTWSYRLARAKAAFVRR